jgi:calcineurin-like phosphoesterase family protein
MNEVLIERWNNVVTEPDRVVVVGDFACAEREAEVWIWLTQLNGKKILVDGNHRPIERSEFKNSELPLTTEYQFDAGKYSFLCLHKIEWFPEEWHEWKIFGHIHNRYPEEYPFIDPAAKRINVSAELLDYTPVSIDRIIDLINRGNRCTTVQAVDRSGDD